VGNPVILTDVSTDAAWEPSPFPEDDDTTRAPARRPWKPATPMTQEELDRYTLLTFEFRTFNPWHCMYNLAAEDGIGYYSGLGKRQCETVLADPTRSRYCLAHATELGVDFYAPPELSEAADKEAATNLTRLVPKAIRTLEQVMDDEDAPPGIRAKSASDILDRTGYAKGVDVRIDARVATVDITAVLADRLDALRDAQLKKAKDLADLAEAEAATAVVSGEIVGTVETDGHHEPGAPGS
jgi:hypothetical protein